MTTPDDGAGVSGALPEVRAAMLAGVFLELIDMAQVYDELLTLREQGAEAEALRFRALQAGREIAVVQRSVWGLMVSTKENLLVGLPRELSPIPALGALQRLCYGFAGLADEDAPPALGLTRDELVGLPEQYALQNWIAAVTRGPGAGAPPTGPPQGDDV